MKREFDRKRHWEKIYKTKELEDVSWYQSTPTTSLDFVKQFDLAKTAKIIDVGGGDSLFVDYLLDLGYQDITVLDISAQAIEKAKQRLGQLASKVKWIIADAADFNPEEKYDFWHDRAAFHFLTSEEDIEHYLDTIRTSLKPTGYLVIGTFSEQGPTKCSGIVIQQYSEQTMSNRLNKVFDKIKCIAVDHKTPSETIQNFIFCSFKRRDTNYTIGI